MANMGFLKPRPAAPKMPKQAALPKQAPLPKQLALKPVKVTAIIAKPKAPKAAKMFTSGPMKGLGKL
jgi:hypothetical protein